LLGHLLRALLHVRIAVRHLGVNVSGGQIIERNACPLRTSG